MSLLKKQEKADPIGEKNGQEEEFHEEAKKSYYAFKNQSKPSKKSDIQAFGFLIIELVKVVDLKCVKSGGLDLIYDLVKKCSFQFKLWSEVQSHQIFEEATELKTEENQSGTDEEESPAAHEPD